MNQNDKRDYAEFYEEEPVNQTYEMRTFCRSRRRRRWLCSSRQLAAMCLGAAVLGGALVGAVQRTQLQQLISAGVSEELQQLAYDQEEGAGLVLDGQESSGAPSVDTLCQPVSTTVNGRTVGGMDVSDIAASALPAIVSITNVSVQEVQRFYDRFGHNSQGRSILKETTSCGSGVIIASMDGALYIVTNCHVVEGATTLSVGFVDGSVAKAEFCGTDSSLDLAVVKVSQSALSDDTLNQITVASIGDSNSLQVGEQVVAIGNALGYGQSVTTGIVSALNRVFSSSSDSSASNAYIQTDAAINPGNSGGALLNMDGQLIGINTAKTASTDVEGMGYAIPISDVWSVIQNLMTRIGAIQADYRDSAF